MPGGGIGSFFVPLIFIFIIMYFVMIRPQKKRQEQQQKLIGSLKTGDRVVTKGAYLVRLASLSTSVPAHGHVH